MSFTLNKALVEAFPPRENDSDFNDLLIVCSQTLDELVRVVKEYDDYKILVHSLFIKNK